MQFIVVELTIYVSLTMRQIQTCCARTEELFNSTSGILLAWLDWTGGDSRNKGAWFRSYHVVRRVLYGEIRFEQETARYSCAHVLLVCRTSCYMTSLIGSTSERLKQDIGPPFLKNLKPTFMMKNVASKVGVILRSTSQRESRSPATLPHPEKTVLERLPSSLRLAH